MLAVCGAVVGVWAVLLGTAYLARGILGLERLPTLALLVACYAAMAVAAAAAIGGSGRSVLAAAGMLVPLAVAAGLTWLTGR